MLWVPPFLSYELWKQRIELSKNSIQTCSNTPSLQRHQISLNTTHYTILTTHINPKSNNTKMAKKKTRSPHQIQMLSSFSYPDFSNVVVLDNGDGLIKAGLGGERNPSTVLPNYLLRPISSKKWITPPPPTPTPWTSPPTQSAAHSTMAT